MTVSSEPIHQTLLTNFSREETIEWAIAHNLPAYRGRQIYEGIFKRLATSFDDMTDLPIALRAELASIATCNALTVEQSTYLEEALTEKALFKMHDGALVEGVLMDYPARTPAETDRHTVCVSTQVGCALGCRFCATGLQGWTRNLTPGEIVGQALHFERVLRKRGAHITNIVYMGMGEPMIPYENTMKSVRLLTDLDGFGLGQRHITISTAGVVPGIRRLTHEGLQVNLAISLHNADNEARSALMPINRRYGLEDLFAAVREYIDVTHRRVSFEWTLIGNVNDGTGDARILAERLRGLLCHVNLIPWNPVGDIPFEPSSRTRALAFQRVLEKAGIPVTMRDTKGSSIQAACGQLKTAATRAKIAGLRPLPVATA